MVAIPTLLIAAVLLLVPRGSPYAASDFGRAQPFSRSNYEDGGKDTGGKGDAAGQERYAVVIDAGSTGSRVHVFKFLQGADGQLALQFDKFDQLKPGLSSYADDPPKAAESLAPLLALAEATVPAELHATTSVMVGATAGLRLLPDGKADVILQEVRAWLRKKPFKVRAGGGEVASAAVHTVGTEPPAERLLLNGDRNNPPLLGVQRRGPQRAAHRSLPQLADGDVKILSGVDEGAFAWLTLNYLLGRLGGSEQDTGAPRGGMGPRWAAVGLQRAAQHRCGWTPWQPGGQHRLSLAAHIPWQRRPRCSSRHGTAPAPALQLRRWTWAGAACRRRTR